jgi:hypothetical protein
MGDDVKVEYSLAEALTGVAAIRDYTRMRREYKMPEDALLGVFYHELFRSLQEAAELDPDAFQRAYELVQVPLSFGEED